MGGVLFLKNDQFMINLLQEQLMQNINRGLIISLNKICLGNLEIERCFQKSNISRNDRSKFHYTGKAFLAIIHKQQIYFSKEKTLLEK